MATRKGAKRAAAPPAAAARPPPAKKTKAPLESTEAMLESVAAAIDKAVSVSPTSREMLRVMSTDCLGTPADQRHRYQVAVAEMLGDALAMAEEALAEGVGTAAAEVGRAGDKVSHTTSSRAALDASLEVQTTALEAAKAAFRTSNQSLLTKRKTLDAAMDHQTRSDGHVQKGEADLEVLEKALHDHVDKLSLESIDLAPHVAALTKLNQEVGMDEGLAQAFKVAGPKDPTLRSAFDKAVVKQLESEYRKRAAQLKKAAEEGSQEHLQRAKAVEGAKALLEEAKEKQREAAQALRAAELNKREAETETWCGKDAERKAAVELRRAEAEHAAAEQDLEEFRAGPLKALELLLAKSAAPPPSEGGEGSANAASAA